MFDPIRSSGRRRRRRTRLTHGVCLRCGEVDPMVLSEQPRLQFEEHHLVGRVNDDATTVTLCRNCHAVLTEMNRDHDLSMECPPTLADRIVAILRQLALFLPALAALLDKLADRLNTFFNQLTTVYPEWEDIDVPW